MTTAIQPLMGLSPLYPQGQGYLGLSEKARAFGIENLIGMSGDSSLDKDMKDGSAEIVNSASDKMRTNGMKSQYILDYGLTIPAPQDEESSTRASVFPCLQIGDLKQDSTVGRHCFTSNSENLPYPTMAAAYKDLPWAQK